MIDHVTNRVKLYIKYNCFSVVYASVIGFQAAILLPRNFMNQYRARTDLTEIILSLYKGKKLVLVLAFLKSSRSHTNNLVRVM